MYQRLLLLPWLTGMVATNIMGYYAMVASEEEVVVNLTTRALQVIPHGGDRPCIAKLIVDGNLITLNEVDQLALASYPGLVELHLDSNLVTTILARYFSAVPRLRVLHLSRNKISRLDPEAFSGLDSLAELDLSNNLLTSLPTQVFRGLNNLQVLNLRGNTLHVLDSRTMDFLDQLRLVDLQENPWNCSCLLLRSINELSASGVAIAGPWAVCASPETQAGGGLLVATAICYPSPPPSSTAASPLLTPPEPVSAQQPRGPPSMPRATPMPTQNHSISNKDQTPAVSNIWKFTLCIAAIALGTSMLIVCAIKWPSWHKLLFSYNHRRLRDEDNEGEEVVSSVFSVDRTYSNCGLDTQPPERSTYKLENGSKGEEEEEDGYIEDLYIERATRWKGYGSTATEEEAISIGFPM